MENIRSTSTTVNYIDCINGEVDNINLRNIEIDYFDRCEILPEKGRAYRGNHLLLVKGAKNVTLDQVELRGSLSGIEANTKITDCDGFIQRNCRL